MTTAADILIRILGDSRVFTKEAEKSEKSLASLNKEVDKSKQGMSAFGNVVQGVFQGIGQAIFSFVTNGVRSAIGGIGQATTAASDLNETISKTNAVFRDSSQDILAWSGTTSRAFGLTQQGALEAASGLGNLFKQLGGSTDDAADFSKTLITLAGDLVAFHNVAGGTEEVLQDIQSAFRGEYDPIQKYIPILNAAVVEQRALAESGKETAKQLTTLDKAMAVQSLIVSGMGDAYGAAAREINSAASQQRIFDARMAESAARLGQVFLPVQQAIFRGLNLIIDTVAPYGENIMDSLAAGLARGIVSILPVLQQVRALFVYWLKPGSPPRLLKELTDWGKGAMAAYLDGWAAADFSTLTNLGGVFEGALRSFAGSGDIKETDLVSRVFGTQKALAQAVRDWRALGMVTEETYRAIDQAAGPAGGAVTQLAREYFELQRATKNVADAQDELNEITDRYAEALDPISQQLDAVRAKQQEIRDNQRLQELGKVIADPRATADARQLARLEAEEIQLERQATALKNERDTALDTAQDKIDALEKEKDAQQQKFDTTQAILDQQEKTNSLIAEETALRQRLIDEGLAEQKRVMAELEAEQRKAEQAERERLAGLERIADAQLRYNLASTDTAGQLEIMRGELEKVAVGSAEYFDILTQILGLEERLKKEREGAGGGLLGPLQEAVGTPGEIEQTSKGIQALSDALDEAFKVLAGTDGKTVELAPAWQNFADMLGNIGQAAQEVIPFVQSLIDFVSGNGGDNSNSTADILRPTGGSNVFSKIYSLVTSTITNLKALKDGDWATLWTSFKGFVTDMLGMTDPATDPRSFSFYSWLQDTMIPAIDALAVGDWKTAWDTMAAGPIEALQSVIDKINETLGLKSAIEEFMNKYVQPNPFQGPAAPGGGGGGGGGEFSSAPGGIPGVAPLIPVMASASSIVNGGDTIYQTITQYINPNGDFGGARQGAREGIRESLIDRRLNGA